MEKKVKKSEERILRYLRLVDTQRRYVALIAQKLDVDYAYLIRILNSMQEKGWITKTKHQCKTYCTVTEQAPTLEKEE